MKYLIIGGSVLLGFYLLNQASKKQENKSTEQATSTANSSGSGSTTSSTNTNTNTNSRDVKLKKGNKGENVKELQRTINKYLPFRYDSLIADGVFGAKTESALKTFWGVYSASVNDVDGWGVNQTIRNYGNGVFLDGAGSSSTSKSGSTYIDKLLGTNFVTDFLNKNK